MQALLDRIPEGESLAKSMAEKLAENSNKFAYDDAVTKSLKMELRALNVRLEFILVFA